MNWWPSALYVGDLVISCPRWGIYINEMRYEERRQACIMPYDAHSAYDERESCKEAMMASGAEHIIARRNGSSWHWRSSSLLVERRRNSILLKCWHASSYHFIDLYYCLVMSLEHLRGNELTARWVMRTWYRIINAICRWHFAFRSSMKHLMMKYISMYIPQRKAMYIKVPPHFGEYIILAASHTEMFIQ